MEDDEVLVVALLQVVGGVKIIEGPFDFLGGDFGQQPVGGDGHKHKGGTTRDGSKALVFVDEGGNGMGTPGGKVSDLKAKLVLLRIGEVFECGAAADGSCAIGQVVGRLVVVRHLDGVDDASRGDRDVVHGDVDKRRGDKVAGHLGNRVVDVSDRLAGREAFDNPIGSANAGENPPTTPVGKSTQVTGQGSGDSVRCFVKHEVALFARPNPDCFPEEILVEGHHGQQFEFPVQGGKHHVSSFTVGVVEGSRKRNHHHNQQSPTCYLPGWTQYYVVLELMASRPGFPIVKEYYYAFTIGCGCPTSPGGFPWSRLRFRRG